MADLINLRSARKNLQRDKAEQQAEENRTKFGRSKADKKLASFELKKSQAALDGKKRDN